MNLFFATLVITVFLTPEYTKENWFVTLQQRKVMRASSAYKQIIETKSISKF